jgi:inhibitor of KinA sporulation pathway (predicted exonuclease)
MFAIIDLEFTSWKGSLERNWKLSWEKREIIQIGAVKFNSFNGNLKYKSIYIKPKFNKKLSSYIQKLTKISQNTIDSQGKNYKSAIEEIDFFLKDVKYIFCNGLDKEIFIENFEIHKIAKNKFVSNIFNLKPFLSEKLKVDGEAIISSEINKFFNFENISIKHNALDDAINIYKCLKLLDDNGEFNLDKIIFLNKKS